MLGNSGGLLLQIVVQITFEFDIPRCLLGCGYGKDFCSVLKKTILMSLRSLLRGWQFVIIGIFHPRHQVNLLLKTCFSQGQSFPSLLPSFLHVNFVCILNSLVGVFVAYIVNSIAGLIIHGFLRWYIIEFFSWIWWGIPAEGPLPRNKSSLYSILEFKVEVNYIGGLSNICKDSFHRILWRGALTILYEPCILYWI